MNNFNNNDDEYFFSYIDELRDLELNFDNLDECDSNNILYKTFANVDELMNSIDQYSKSVGFEYSKQCNYVYRDRSILKRMQILCNYKDKKRTLLGKRLKTTCEFGAIFNRQENGSKILLHTMQ